MPPDAKLALAVIIAGFIAFVIGKLSGYREAMKDARAIYESLEPLEVGGTPHPSREGIVDDD